MIEAKRHGFEKGVMPMGVNVMKIETTIKDLYKRIDDAYSASTRPDRPTYDQIQTVNQFLVALRKDMVR